MFRQCDSRKRLTYGSTGDAAIWLSRCISVSKANSAGNRAPASRFLRHVKAMTDGFVNNELPMQKTDTILMADEVIVVKKVDVMVVPIFRDGKSCLICALTTFRDRIWPTSCTSWLSACA